MKGWRKSFGHWKRVLGRGKRRVTIDVCDTRGWPWAATVRVESCTHLGDIEAALEEVLAFVRAQKADNSPVKLAVGP